MQPITTTDCSWELRDRFLEWMRHAADLHIFSGAGRLAGRAGRCWTWLASA